MDALDILSDLHKVIPYFQPIVSADEHRVIGYEILGRYEAETGVISLGAFFQDDQIPEEYRIEVDNRLLTIALNKALELENDALLFINRDASLLMYDQDEESLLHLLLSFSEKGISLERIVLEINEQSFSGDFDQLDHLLNYYRTYGIKIALSKKGSDSHHLDRIGQLEPDILKVNLDALRSNTQGASFQDIAYTLAMLARKIGATLLFENIEMSFQLQFAWKTGGRFYQGFYLAAPSPDFVHQECMKERLKEEFHRFIAHEKKKLEAIFSVNAYFHLTVQELLAKHKKTGSYEDFFKVIGREMDHIAFRVYVCDGEGFQKSPNMYKNVNEWIFQPEYINKNWSWRPYFLENIIKMRSDKKGLLSDLYSDIETGETIRTFSYPIDSNHFLFIDISYSYLFENDDLI